VNKKALTPFDAFEELHTVAEGVWIHI
jgi:hypothetical protein